MKANDKAQRQLTRTAACSSTRAAESIVRWSDQLEGAKVIRDLHVTIQRDDSFQDNKGSLNQTLISHSVVVLGGLYLTELCT